MRIALITLAVAALAFIGSIIWIFAQKNGIDILPNNPSTTTVKISNETAAIEILRSQWKTEDRIKELEAKIDALGSKNTTPDQTTILENIGKTSSIKSSTGSLS